MNSSKGTAPSRHGDLQELVLNMKSLLVRKRNFRFLHSRPEEIYPFCTPLVLSQEAHRGLAELVELFSTALEEIGARLASNRTLARQWLGFSSCLEEEFFFLDHGYSKRLPVRRMDMAMDSQGRMALMEINCGCPGGELDPALVAEAYLQAENRPERQGLFLDPRDESLGILLECYEEFRKARAWMPSEPTIALLSSRAQAYFMLPECRGIASHYRAKGYRALVGTLEDLEADRDCLLLKGEPVHLVFRKFSTSSLRLRLEKKSHYTPSETLGASLLWEAACAGRVCLVNPLGSTMLQDKGLLELLWEAYPKLRAHLPRTFVLGPHLRNQEPELFQILLSGQRFVLKKRVSYGGRHVILDPGEIRNKIPQVIKEEPRRWVAQGRIRSSRRLFVAWDGTSVRTGAFPFVLSPFGRSAFVRVGLQARATAPINAHGGSATTFLMLRP